MTGEKLRGTKVVLQTQILAWFYLSFVLKQVVTVLPYQMSFSVSLTVHCISLIKLKSHSPQILQKYVE